MKKNRIKYKKIAHHVNKKPFFKQAKGKKNYYLKNILLFIK